MTPNGARITLTKLDGSTVDVTEHVGAIYDLVIQSMDFGSGFLTSEDAEPLAELGEMCGFARCDEAKRYLDEARRQEERQARTRQRLREKRQARRQTVDAVSCVLTVQELVKEHPWVGLLFSSMQ